MKKINYLIGSKEEFYEFLGNIKSEDKIAILTHTDLDGIGSGIFIEEILKEKNLKVDLIKFLDYKVGLFKNLKQELKDKKISKVFICDFGIDTEGVEDFWEFKKTFDVFWIDHHPFENLENKKNIIKTKSSDCSTQVIYDLGEGIIDQEKWLWLVCSTILSDFGFKDEDNLEFVQENYSDVKYEKVFDSEPGEIAKKISSSLIYYKNNLRKVYDLVKKKDFDEINKIHKFMDEEIQKQVYNYLKNSEYYPEKKIYIYEVKSEYNVASIVSTIVSQREPEKMYLVINNLNNGFLKISFREQGGFNDTSTIVKKGIRGLENAIGGGHARASSAKILEKDLDKFKTNILG